MPIKPVILCGGSGTRLWPESRENLPKQFIPLFSKKTLLDLTLERLSHLGEIITPIMTTNKNYGFMVRQSLAKSNLNSFLLLEPLKRNTAAIIYLAAKFSNEDDRRNRRFPTDDKTKGLREDMLMEFSGYY